MGHSPRFPEKWIKSECGGVALMSRTKQVMEVFLTLISSLLLVQDARGKLYSDFTVLVVYFNVEK